VKNKIARTLLLGERETRKSVSSRGGKSKSVNIPRGIVKFLEYMSNMSTGCGNPPRSRLRGGWRRADSEKEVKGVAKKIT